MKRENYSKKNILIKLYLILINIYIQFLLYTKINNASKYIYFCELN